MSGKSEGCQCMLSLVPPSKIGTGSGELRIIDLCHKPNIGSTNHISERNSYLIVTSYQI